MAVRRSFFQKRKNALLATPQELLRNVHISGIPFTTFRDIPRLVARHGGAETTGDAPYGMSFRIAQQFVCRRSGGVRHGGHI